MMAENIHAVVPAIFHEIILEGSPRPVREGFKEPTTKAIVQTTNGHDNKSGAKQPPGIAEDK